MAKEPATTDDPATDTAAETTSRPAQQLAPAQPQAQGQPQERAFPQPEGATADPAKVNITTLSPLHTGDDQVECVATGSFHEEGEFQGRLLQAGDKFSTSRGRAVELRAGGLISYADKGDEDKAAADDPTPSTDGGRPAITMRSFRRTGRK